MVIGNPVVFPLNKPLLKIGKSSSCLGVVPFCLPPFLLSRSGSKSSDVNDKPEGQPSIVIPTHSPCDSPKMETLNILPNEFNAYRFKYWRVKIHLLLSFSNHYKNPGRIYLLPLLLQ